MRRIGRTLPSLVFVLCLSGCPSLTDAVSAGSGKQTYPSIWINASWSGGRTGTPLESKAVTPSNIIGSYCPASALTFLNHYATYALQGLDGGLVVNNNCTVLIYEAAICNTAGSGGIANSFGICGTDPRKTSRNNVLIIPLPSSSTRNWFGNTSPNLDVNLFYCATGSHLNFGEVAGKDPTDCVVN